MIPRCQSPECNKPLDMFKNGRAPKYCGVNCRMTHYRRRKGIRPRAEVDADPKYRAKLRAAQERRRARSL